MSSARARTALDARTPKRGAARTTDDNPMPAKQQKSQRSDDATRRGSAKARPPPREEPEEESDSISESESDSGAETEEVMDSGTVESSAKPTPSAKPSEMSAKPAPAQPAAAPAKTPPEKFSVPKAAAQQQQQQAAAKNDEEYPGGRYSFDDIDIDKISLKPSSYKGEFQKVLDDVMHDDKPLVFNIPPSVVLFSRLHALGSQPFKKTNVASLATITSRDLELKVLLGEVPESLEPTLGALHQRAVQKYKAIVDRVRELVVQENKVHPGVFAANYDPQAQIMTRVSKDPEGLAEALAVVRASAMDKFWQGANMPEFVQTADGKMTVELRAKAKAVWKKKQPADGSPPIPDATGPDFEFADAGKLTHQEITRIFATFPRLRAREIAYLAHKRPESDGASAAKKFEPIGRTELAEDKTHQELFNGDLCKFAFSMSFYEQKSAGGHWGLKHTLAPFFPKVTIYSRRDAIGPLPSRGNFGYSEANDDADYYEDYDLGGFAVYGDSASASAMATPANGHSGDGTFSADGQTFGDAPMAAADAGEGAAKSVESFTDPAHGPYV